MDIHDPTPIEILLEEVEHAFFVGGGGGDVEDGLVGREGGDTPEIVVLREFCAGELAVQGLQARFAQVGEGGGVVFEGGEEFVFVG